VLRRARIVAPVAHAIIGARAKVRVGARFINKPLLKYRIHSQNNSLRLIAERSDELERLLTMDRIFQGHLAHAVVMKEELDRLSVIKPSRYAELAPEIGPLLTTQTVEMATESNPPRRP
jgi:hypothetical protein